MFKRQTTGSVVCASCGYLVGVRDEKCYHCGRSNPGLWGFAPALRSLGHDLGFVPFVTGTCIVVYGLALVMTILAGGTQEVMQPSPFGFLGPGFCANLMFGASGRVPVFAFHRWWTVLTAGWLHAGLLHIAFNLIWIRQLAPAVAEMYGPGRMVVIYTIAGVAGFALTSVGGFVPLPLLHGAGFTVGASAPIFGLLGALVYYGRRSGSSLVGGQAWSMAVTMFVFGLIMPGVDNFAHAGGFAGGYVAGRWLDPLKPERVNHMLGAVVCLGVTILAIVWSVVHYFVFIPVFVRTQFGCF